MRQRRLLIFVAVLLMIAGIWLATKTGGTTTPNPATATDPGTQPDASPPTGGAPAPEAPATSASPSVTVVPPPVDGGPVFTVTSIEGLPVETVPTVPPPLPDWVPEGGLVVQQIDPTGCTPNEAGFGVELKPWGDILLPYAAEWPTNPPGQAPNCAPDTAFGAAVVAAHALYLDALHPVLIPTIADDTPGRWARIKAHPGPMDPATIGVVCEVVGWSQATFRQYRIYTRCGTGPVKATTATMTRKADRWLLVYPASGVLTTRDAQPGEAYYPFAGGD